MDLTDRLFYHRDALAFLRVAAEEPKDSALLESLEVGPSVSIDAVEKDSEASGRILWGQLETVADLQATLMLGSSKGALVNAFARRGTATPAFALVPASAASRPGIAALSPHRSCSAPS